MVFLSKPTQHSFTHMKKLKVIRYQPNFTGNIFNCVSSFIARTQVAAAESWLADLANSNREDLAGWYNGAC